jgi:hypothetical protein
MDINNIIDIMEIENPKIDEILVDSGEPHSFVFKKNFFPTLVAWQKIFKIERSLFFLKVRFNN